MDYRGQYDRYVAMIEETIEKILPQTETDCPNDMQIPRHLCEAMRYSLLAGGKRLRPVLLLAGGRFKGGDLAGLAPLLKRHVKAAGLYGASREVFENAWKDILPTSWDETLRLALARLRGMARPGDVVLLAPATSSYDQYENYRERGDDFRRAVLEQD